MRLLFNIDSVLFMRESEFVSGIFSDERIIMLLKYHDLSFVDLRARAVVHDFGTGSSSPESAIQESGTRTEKSSVSESTKPLFSLSHPQIPKQLESERIRIQRNIYFIIIKLVK